MEKKSIKSLFTILGGVIFCIVMFLFASCENFLKSGDIANEIKEAIEIANSNPVSIFITPDENSGTAVPNQIQAKKNQSFILTFLYAIAR